MARKIRPEKRAAIIEAIESGESNRSIARTLGVSPSTVHQLKATRTAEEFTTPAKRERMASAVAPTRRGERVAWDLERIRSARDAQIQGNFGEAVRLATMLGTDDALFNARRYRVSPVSSLTARLTAAQGVRGESVARRALHHTLVSRSVLTGISRTFVDHGIAIGKISTHVDEDGRFVSYSLEEWPLEFVRYDRTREVLETEVYGGPPMPIVHGDGVWVVFAKTALLPWIHDAAILPAAFVWPAHAESLKSWALSSDSHGLARVWGELPAGIALQDENENMTPEATAFLDMLAGIVEGTQAAGIAPPGAKVNFVSNPSNAWQVFTELVKNRERAAARIYLGTDAILGSTGDAPGVDISQLFGVASTLIQTDLQAIVDSLSSGFYEPWTAINYGDSRLAPHLEFDIPDPDRDRKSEQASARETRLFDALDRYTERGMVIDQSVVDRLAAKYGVDPSPQLAETQGPRVSIELAPTDIARVVRVREARASQGLPPLDDPRDDKFISELEAEAEARQ